MMRLAHLFTTIALALCVPGSNSAASLVRFDVTRFGAAADGADVRPAFQAAELAARRHKLAHPDDDVEIVIPAGTWYYETGAMDSGMEWTIGADITVRGAGMHATTIHVGPDPQPQVTLFFLRQSEGTEIRLADFSIEGPEVPAVIDGQFSSFGIWCDGAATHVIERVGVRRFQGGIVTTPNVDGPAFSHVRDCEVQAYETAVFMRQDWDDGSFLDIDGGVYECDDPFDLALVPSSALYTSHSTAVRIRNAHVIGTDNYAFQSTGGYQGFAPAFVTLENVLIEDCAKGVLMSRYARESWIRDCEWLLTDRCTSAVRLQDNDAIVERCTLNGPLAAGASCIECFEPIDGRTIRITDVKAEVDGVGAKFLRVADLVGPAGAHFDLERLHLNMEGEVLVCDAPTAVLELRDSDLVGRQRFAFLRGGTLEATNNDFLSRNGSNYFETVPVNGDVTLTLLGNVIRTSGPEVVLEVESDFTSSITGSGNTYLAPTLIPPWEE